MTAKETRARHTEYYDRCMLQFLGFEKDIFTTSQKNVYVFYHYSFGKLKLYTAANKLNQPSKRKWITGADTFIHRFILFDKSCPTVQEYYRETLF